MGTFKISIRCVLPQLIFWLATISNLSLFLAAVQASNPAIDFNRDIRPILSDKCIRCHGPDSAARQAELRLDREHDAKTDHSGHTPVVPGHPEQSELYRRITNTDIDERMPPAKSGKTLSAEEIDLLRRWIAEGGQWMPAWAYVPPKKLPVPKLTNPILPSARQRAKPKWLEKRATFPEIGSINLCKLVWSRNTSSFPRQPIIPRSFADSASI